MNFLGKTAIALGNEHDGVSDELAAAADHTILIPMMGMVQSLNVSVASAVVLYEALRQRMAAGGYGSETSVNLDEDPAFQAFAAR